MHALFTEGFKHITSQTNLYSMHIVNFHNMVILTNNIPDVSHDMLTQMPRNYQHPSLYDFQSSIVEYVMGKPVFSNTDQQL